MFKFVSIFALIAVASAGHLGHQSYGQSDIQHGGSAYSHHSHTQVHAPSVPVYHSASIQHAAPIHQHHHEVLPIHHEPVHFSAPELHSHHSVPLHSAPVLQSHGHDLHGAHGAYHHHH